MAGILHSAAQLINTNTAGQTNGPPTPADATGGRAVDSTPENVLAGLPNATGALDHMFRQEPVAPALAATATEVASAATRGPNGGLVPLGGNTGGGPGPTIAPPPEAATYAHNQLRDLFGGHPQSQALGLPGNGVAPETTPVSLAPITLGGARSDVVASAQTARTTGANIVAGVRRRLGL
jgi:hypothetical protein